MKMQNNTINDKEKMNIDLVYPGSLTIGPAPYALVSLAPLLEQEGFNVRIVDFDGIPITYENVSKKFKNKTPDIIGITAYTTPLLERAAIVTEYVRKLFPESFILWGGVHATIFPREILQELPVDAVVVGEGELTLLELAKSIQQDRDLSKVRGIYYKKDDEILKTPERELIKYLNKLPMPSWYLINYFQHNYIYLIESRGCPYRCSFCYKHMWKKYRSKSVDKIIEEIKYLQTLFNLRIFKFWDDLPFGGNVTKMIDFCETVQQEELDIKWTCFIRPEMIKEELLEAFEKAGCFRVAMGVESGSPKMLDLLNKQTTPEEYRKSFKLLSKYPILSVASFMLGLPGEEMGDLKLTLELAKEIKATEYYAQNYKPYPNTELYEAALKQGFKEPRSIYEWAHYSNFDEYNVNTSNIPLDVLIKARKTILGLNNNPKKYYITAGAILHQFKASPGTEMHRAVNIFYNKLRYSGEQVEKEGYKEMRKTLYATA